MKSRRTTTARSPAVGQILRATEPLFQALKDDKADLVTVSRGYREPVCFYNEVGSANTSSSAGRFGISCCPTA